MKIFLPFFLSGWRPAEAESVQPVQPAFGFWRVSDTNSREIVRDDDVPAA